MSDVNCIVPGCTYTSDSERGVKVHVGMVHDIKSLIIEDIQNVASELGHVPTRSEYRKHGKFSDITVDRNFDRWVDGQMAAGFEPTSTKSLTDKEVLGYLEDVIDELGRSPTRPEFNERAPICAYTVHRRFESWPVAIMKLGYDPVEYTPDWDDLLDEIQRLHEKQGRVTTYLMNDHGRFHSMTYIRRFGSWKEAVVEAGFEEPTKGAPGEEHPNWKGGHCDWRGPNWPSVRDTVRERDNHECCVCEEPATYERATGHQVHHIKSFREYDSYEEANQLENLVLLCQPCHSKLGERWPDLDHGAWVARARESGLVT